MQEIVHFYYCNSTLNSAIHFTDVGKGTGGDDISPGLSAAVAIIVIIAVALAVVVVSTVVALFLRSISKKSNAQYSIIVHVLYIIPEKLALIKSVPLLNFV
jgi:hypothetical protein